MERQCSFWRTAKQSHVHEVIAKSFPIMHRSRLDRYLTKITDQVIALISEEHASSIIWKEDSEDYVMDVDETEVDRLFTFEVSKTNEKEENVSSSAGFVVR